MRHIFVSYCHEDADFAQILEGKVRDSGFSTWRDLNLTGGDDWRAEIDDGIKDALAVVVVMSPNSRSSAYVNYEWSFALGSGVPVVPVLLKLSPDCLHPRLGAIQYLDFGNYLLRPWDKLAESLRELADAEREFSLRVPRDAPPVVRAAAQALDDMDPARRRSAIASLAQMDHPAALQLLADAVHHPIREVRFGAAFHLGGTLHDPRALPTLIEALRCQDGEFELWMIVRIGEPAVPALLETLQEKDFPRRDDLFTILGAIGGAAAVQALIGYLRDPDRANRVNAAFTLSSTTDSTALPALREAMRDPDPEVRRGVASALGRCGGALEISDLLEMLHDPESGVRHGAAVSLEEICEARPVPAAMEPLIPRLIDALLDVLDDPYDQARFFAGNSLKKLRDARAVPGLIAALGQERAHPERITDVLRGLEEIAVPALRQAIDHPNELVRLTAAEGVARFGDDADALCVAGILQDKNPDIRLRAIRALGYRLHGSKVILQALIERLQDPEEDIGIAAIEKLGDIRNVTSAPHLIECLKVEALAPAAAEALQWFDTREARTALKDWNKHKRE